MELKDLGIALEELGRWTSRTWVLLEGLKALDLKDLGTGLEELRH